MKITFIKAIGFYLNPILPRHAGVKLLQSPSCKLILLSAKVQRPKQNFLHKFFYCTTCVVNSESVVFRIFILQFSLFLQVYLCAWTSILIILWKEIVFSCYFYVSVCNRRKYLSGNKIGVDRECIELLAVPSTFSHVQKTKWNITKCTNFFLWKRETRNIF